MRRGIALSWVVLAGEVAAALLVAFVAQTRPAGSAFPGKNGRIAFVSNRPGSNFYDIYKMSFTGTNVRPLTSGPRRGRVARLLARRQADSLSGARRRRQRVEHLGDERRRFGQEEGHRGE
jgi:hypothetical protein